MVEVEGSSRGFGVYYTDTDTRYDICIIRLIVEECIGLVGLIDDWHYDRRFHCG